MSLSLAVAAAALLSTSAVGSGRAIMGEVWVWPVLFQQSLAPLAAVANDVTRDGSCPDLVIGADRVIHRYQFEAQMKRRGGQNVRFEVTDLRITNPSGCDSLDARVRDVLRQAVPTFAEPRRDEDGNGWLRLPQIELRAAE
jgi:hypothetical protein